MAVSQINSRSAMAPGKQMAPPSLGIRRHTTRVDVRVSKVRRDSSERMCTSRTSRVDLAVPVPNQTPTEADSRHSRKPRQKPFDPNDDYDYGSTDDEEEETADNKLQDVGARTYATVCRQYKTVPVINVMRQFGNRAISLQDFNLNPRELRAFFLAAVECYINSNLVQLGRDNELSELKLGGNIIREPEMVYLCDFMSVHYPLVNLTLNRCFLGTGVLEILAEFVRDNSTLRKLDLSENGFTDNESPFLANIIEHGHSITELVLRRNKIGDSAAIIGDALARNLTLTNLDLSWNHIRGIGAVGFCINGIQENYSVKTLNLAWNGFGSTGMSAMAAALAENTILSVLDISNNGIHGAAGLELLKGLHENHTLKVLKIGHNPITSAMTSVLLTQLLKCTETNLTELDLEGIVVDENFEDVLKEIQQDRLFVVRYDKSLPLCKGAIEPVDHNNLFNIDPLRTMKFMQEHMRTIECFLNVDKDSKGFPSRDEMKKAFEIEGFAISDIAFEEVLKYLNVSMDGVIDLLLLKKKMADEILRLSESLHRSDNSSDAKEPERTTSVGE